MNVTVEHTITIYSDKFTNSIKDLYEKYGDRLIDWKVAIDNGSNYHLWFVLKGDENTPNDKIKI